MDPDVYRIPSAAEVVAMLQTAGFDYVEHESGDPSNHDIHLFLARLPG
jgi:hypothetical protein